MTRKPKQIDTSTKGARPTASEASKALAIYAALRRPKRPPTGAK